MLLFRLLIIFGLACFSGGAVITKIFPTSSIVPAFYVATNGSDGNVGTLASPFLTLGKCQTAMRGSSVKTCYIRAGNYTPAAVSSCGIGGTCAVQLSTADNGETWSYYPPDNVDSADITGGTTATGNGLYVIFDVQDAANITINGLSLHNFDFAAIASIGGASTLTVKNNLIFNGFFVVGAGAQNAGAFMCYGCANTTISHNAVHDIASFGIGSANVNGNTSNQLVTGNVLYNICTALADCGAIYTQDTTATVTNIQWTNNYVRDGNTNATLGSGAGNALYLDDCTSNVTVSGNIVTGRWGSQATMIHGGNNNNYTGNLIDLTSFGTTSSILSTQTSTGFAACSAQTMSGNQFGHNIIISGSGGGGYTTLGSSPGNFPTMVGNDYFAEAGSAISHAGDFTDPSPNNVDPQLSCWIYNIASGSSVFNSPINFPAIVGGWGPPGYVIPQTGTAPSSPHTC